MGYKSSNMVVAGDSAGGCHGGSRGLSSAQKIDSILTAVVLTHFILQSDQLSPRGVVTFAPTVLQAYDHLSKRAKANADTDILTVPMVKGLSSAYVGDTGVASTDPLVSAAFLPFTASWPKTLILVGTGDLTIDASHELEKRLAALNLPVELVEYDERPHAWWSFAHIFPEDIQDAAARVARFME